MRMVDLIAAKRDGGIHTKSELEWIIHGMLSGEIPDYQVSAWLMAIVWRGMTEQETIDLTDVMIHSGEVLDLHDIAPFLVDKHSTGGVGDKTSLVVAPLVAAAGLPVVKMSGRGLGFTGGTLDKLEAIPGFQVNLSVENLKRTVREHGIAIASQTHELAPADGKLYALRDVTATVPSLPLIASSIMSKKIASGADAIVLDVKVGRGAFMQTIAEARALALMMIRIGQGLGKRVTAVLADMSQPLGWAVGNALEVQEAILTLQGNGPADLHEHCQVVAAEMLLIGGLVQNQAEGIKLLQMIIDDGRGLAKFREWVAAQHGDARVVDSPGLFPQAPVVVDCPAALDGYVVSIDAREVGLISGYLGAGREHKGDPVDPAVGLVLQRKVGQMVQAGQPLASIHARNAAEAQLASERLAAAYRIGPQKVAPPPTILEVLHS
ncbi:MAG: thymidine phosphorylase [Anaerolineae bacterium]